MVGEKWTILILREAFFGVHRYGQLVRNLGIPRPTLSARLRTLVDAGLLERVRYATEPDLYEYRLTGAGIPARSTPTGRYVTGSELVIDGGVSA